jgi:hypothetical protein
VGRDWRLAAGVYVVVLTPLVPALAHKVEAGPASEGRTNLRIQGLIQYVSEHTETPRTVSNSRLTKALATAIERPVKKAVREALADEDVTLVTLDAGSTAESGDEVERDDGAGTTGDGKGPESRSRRLAAAGAVLPLVAGLGYLQYRCRSGRGAETVTEREATHGEASDPERATSSPADPMVDTAQ